MFRESADISAEALAWAVSTATIGWMAASQAVADIGAPTIANEVMYGVAVAAGLLAGILAAGIGRGHKSERIATALTCVIFAVLLGPPTALIIIYGSDIPVAQIEPVVGGVSFLYGLIGWPIYKAFRALLRAVEEHPESVSIFIGRVFKNFFNKDRNGRD